MRDRYDKITLAIHGLAFLVTVLVAAFVIRELGELQKQNKELSSSINAQVYENIIDSEFNALASIQQFPDIQSQYLRNFGLQSEGPESDASKVGAILLFEFFDNVFFTYRHDALPPGEWANWERAFDNNLHCFGVMADVWEAISVLYGPEYRQLVADLLQPLRHPEGRANVEHTALCRSGMP